MINWPWHSGYITGKSGAHLVIPAVFSIFVHSKCAKQNPFALWLTLIIIKQAPRDMVCVRFEETCDIFLEQPLLSKCRSYHHITAF